MAILHTLLLPLLLLVGALQDDLVEEQLKQARLRLGSAPEPEFRQGVRMCATLDSAESMSLLLSVLDETKGRRSLPPAHYRDVAWEGVTEFRSEAARARVAQELKKNKKNPWCRAWCAELLGIFGDATHGEVLEKALKDRSVEVRRAAARALGRVGREEAVPALEKAAAHKDAYLRANAVEALARIDAATHRELFLDRLASDQDGGVRCALLHALVEVYPDEVTARSVAGVSDEDWRPRLQAVENLQEIRTRQSIDGLVVAANDARPVVRNRAFHALSLQTGLKHRKGKAWEEWWEGARDTFEIPDEPFEPEEEIVPGATVAEYHGIRVESDHVAFLMDRSAAMREWLASKDASKQDASEAELATVFAQLGEGLVFNVYAYESEFKRFAKEPVAFDERAAKRALGFVAKQPIRASKDVWQVLEDVISDPTLDTVYLLSSGEPEVGLYVHYNRITDHLSDLNRFHKVVVHTVAFTSSEYYRDQLVKISEATGGEFRWFQ